MAEFFSQLERPFQAYLDSLRRDEAYEKDRRRRLLSGAISSFLESPEDYDTYAPLTTGWVGPSLQSAIQARDTSEDAVKRTLATSARIIREATIRRSAYNAVEREILDFYLDQNDELSGEERLQADYIRHSLPRSILESTLSGVANAERNANTTKEHLFDGVRELEKRISGYKTELEKLTSDYNFIGLASAFKNLLSQKNWEKWVTFTAVMLLGVIAIAVPITLLVLRESKEWQEFIGNQWSPAGLANFIAVVGLEVIALYYFRVALKNYQVTRNQITNLKLRYAVCAFIEGYLDFRKRSSSKDGHPLSAFEQLIFADLPSGPDGLPNTLDGISQITDLIRAVRQAT
jgi:hypothetical protein